MPESGKPPITPVLDHYGWPGRVSGYGAWRNTNCPFHGDDRNPSARVNEDEGVFHCFTCEVSGDAYALVMAAEQCDFPKAKELVREWTGFDLDSGNSSRRAPGGAGGSALSSSGRLVSSKLPAWAKAKHSRKLV